jgi:hypothetical protein
MLKLPKGVVADPKSGLIEKALKSNLADLWANGALKIPVLEFSERIQTSLKALSLNDGLKQGLESATKTLDREKHGLTALEQKTGKVQNERLSRFIILANDGSERFYRDAESLLLRHGDRLLGCKFDITSDVLGTVLLPHKKAAKALLIDDRKSLEAFLLSLV